MSCRIFALILLFAWSNVALPQNSHSDTVPKERTVRYRLHNEKEYAQYPHLALSDADTLRLRGDYDEAVKRYRIYGALSGEDMTAVITETQRLSMPSWFNARKMKAIPLDNGDMLIMYKMRYTNTLWDQEMNNELTIPGIDGTWARTVSDEVFQTLSSSDVIIPDDGLYAGNYAVTSDIKVNGKRSQTTTYIIKLITSAGGKTVEEGSHTETTEKKSYGSVTTVNDTKHNIKFHYYPYRIIRKITKKPGKWRMVKYTDREQ